MNSTCLFQVTGDSIYNLTRLSEIETDKDDRPLDPPKILSVEVSRIKQTNKHTYILLNVNGIILQTPTSFTICHCFNITFTFKSNARGFYFYNIMLRSQVVIGVTPLSNTSFIMHQSQQAMPAIVKNVAPLDFFDKIIMWEGSDQLVFFLNSLF